MSQIFSLAVDASDVGMGAVLSQEYKQGLLHSISYCPKKVNVHQKASRKGGIGFDRQSEAI